MIKNMRSKVGCIAVLMLLLSCSQQELPTNTPVLATQSIPQGVIIDPTRPLFIDVRVVNNPSWVEITIDGDNKVKGLQVPGWKQRFEVNGDVMVRAGSESDVEVSIQGRAYTKVGPKSRAAGTFELKK